MFSTLFENSGPKALLHKAIYSITATVLVAMEQVSLKVFQFPVVNNHYTSAPYWHACLSYWHYIAHMLNVSLSKPFTVALIENTQSVTDVTVKNNRKNERHLNTRKLLLKHNSNHLNNSVWTTSNKKFKCVH